MLGFIIGVGTMSFIWLFVKSREAAHKKNEVIKAQAEKAIELVQEENPKNGYYFNIAKAVEELVNPECKAVLDTGSLSNACEVYIKHLANQIKKHPDSWRLNFQI